MDRWQFEEPKQEGIYTEFSVLEQKDASAFFVKQEWIESSHILALRRILTL